MKVNEIAKLLADRINQEHYILHYMNKVYKLGYNKGVEDSLRQPVVSGRSEQLKAFLEWRDKQNILTLHDYDNDELIRLYEKSL